MFVNPRPWAMFSLALLMAGCAGSPEQTPLMPELEVTPPPQTGVAEQPHLHDYWGGKELVTVMDEDITIDPETAAGNTFYDVLVAGQVAAGGSLFTLPEGQTVFEGTGTMDITLSWDHPAITAAALRFRSAESSEYSDAAAIQKGTPLVIEVTPAMTDMPHDRLTRWAFLVEPKGNGDAVSGVFHVKVDIRRVREIEAWPAHPDRWGNATWQVLLDADGESHQENSASFYANLVTAREAELDDVAPAVPVAMGTQEIIANITVMSATSKGGEINNMSLRYKTAGSGSYSAADLIGGDVSARQFSFAIPVAMTDTDNPYSTQSDWRFDFVWSTTDPAGASGDCQGCFDADVSYEIEVIAYRESHR